MSADPALALAQWHAVPGVRWQDGVTGFDRAAWLPLLWAALLLLTGEGHVLRRVALPTDGWKVTETVGQVCAQRKCLALGHRVERRAARMLHALFTQKRPQGPG